MEGKPRQGDSLTADGGKGFGALECCEGALECCEGALDLKGKKF